MPPLNQNQFTAGPYWRSLEEFADTPAFRQFVQREFPNHAAEWLQGDRRNFLKIMGASLALAGLGGCARFPVEKLVPYAHRPANRDPGVPVQYTTAMDFGGIGQGMLVTSVDGRPIKVDGNPMHPLNRGGSDSFGQASVLNVYDPDRSRTVRQQPAAGQPVDTTWAAFESFWKVHLAQLKKSHGQTLAILAENSSSPSVVDMRRRFQLALPQAHWFEYEPVSDDNAREGTRLAFGEPLRVVPELAAAQVLVSFDWDFLVGDPLSVKFAHDFAAGRRLTDPATGRQATRMNRLYVVESTFSMTGSHAENARHRFAVAAKDIPIVAGLLAAELERLGLAATVAIPALPAPPPGVELAALRALAQDLLAHRGRCVLLAGPGQPPELHALIAILNAALDNTGRTVHYYPAPDPQRPVHVEAITRLTGAIRRREISTLVILGGNPVYNAPADLDFAAALAAVPVSVHLADYVDETSRRCTWHLPRCHYLESWGDARTYNGLVSIAQPLIEPIFGGRSTIELLALLIEDPVRNGYEIVQRTLGIHASEWRWKKALFDGYVEKTAQSPAHPSPHALAVGQKLSPLLARAAEPLGLSNLELVYRPDRKVYDGRWANNGWLQELPEPMTRLTWDNAALISPKTAAALGLDPHQTHLIQVQIAGRALAIAAYIMPGQPDHTITVALGYGRSSAGNVGDNVGFNGYTLRTSAAMYSQTGARVTVTAETHELASTQNHFVIGTLGRQAIAAEIPDLIHQGTFADWLKQPALGHKKSVAVNLWQEHRFDTGYQWGMAVDLTACIGCSACVVACRAENNVPIVGKQQVLMGREMDWIRIDRYFRGPDASAPECVHEPVMCMQCENAPCEAVCPVGATSTAPDGLNTMTYNRCIGTRYCAANCPYKVRRFNFLDYNSGTLRNLYEPNILRQPMNDLTALQKNPQVSIRVRGVMEKCTYCVQRIAAATITAQRENRRIRDGEITPACAQACPAEALVFGDIRDPNSRVATLQRQSRSYGILNNLLLTAPRTEYLPKVWNPNPALPAPPPGPLGSQ